MALGLAHVFFADCKPRQAWLSDSRSKRQELVPPEMVQCFPGALPPETLGSGGLWLGEDVVYIF